MNIRSLMPTRITRKAARIAAVAAIGAGAVAGSVGAAQADSSGWQDSWSGSYMMTASYDFLNVAISGGSTSVGAPAIQWAADGGYEQLWYFGTVTYDGAYQGTLIENAHSGLCLDTDGTAGDTLYQQVCEYGNNDELFNLNGGLGTYNTISNVGTGLYMDVNSYSWNEGQGIDLWYQNAQPNQTFAVLAYS